eukprot:scaffold305_cov247-Pinguiococcus_pyrenoidosus.AAC.5
MLSDLSLVVLGPLQPSLDAEADQVPIVLITTINSLKSGESGIGNRCRDLWVRAICQSDEQTCCVVTDLGEVARLPRHQL